MNTINFQFHQHCHHLSPDIYHNTVLFIVCVNMLIVFSVDLKVFFTVDNTDKQVINYMNGLFPDYFTTRSVLSMSCVCDF